MASIEHGGVIPNKGVNLTCVGTTLLSVGDWVEVVDEYEVDIPTTRGSLSVVGYIIVANSAIGEDVTVAGRGNSVEEFTAGGAIDAGDPVVINDEGEVVAYDPTSSPGSGDSCCSIVGIALTSAADGSELDVMVL